MHIIWIGYFMLFSKLILSWDVCVAISIFIRNISVMSSGHQAISYHSMTACWGEQQRIHQSFTLQACRIESVRGFTVKMFHSNFVFSAINKVSSFSGATAIPQWQTFYENITIVHIFYQKFPNPVKQIGSLWEVQDMELICMWVLCVLYVYCQTWGWYAWKYYAYFMGISRYWAYMHVNMIHTLWIVLGEDY